ncbi:MAG: hypothetical protein E6099_12920 [Enterobacter sp.]|nr:hypothetical protein [Enterobacter sp.]
MSEVKVNGSACCDRPGRAAFTVPAKDCRHSAGQRRFANGSQTGEGYIQGQVQQVPGQSQNCGPGNSTGDG